MVLPRRRHLDTERRLQPAIETVESRRLLLDALEALGPVLPAVVLGGGQALDLRLPDDALPMALSTHDADLTVDVATLVAPPALGARLREAGMEPTGSHGHWARAPSRRLDVLLRRPAVQIDLLVPAEPWPTSVAGPDPRDGGDASLMPPMVLTLLDDEPVEVPALEPADPRRVGMRVAGLASLLLTKVHKFETRRRRAVDRHRPLSTIPAKDVLDVVRLLLSPSEALEAGVDRLRRHPRGAQVAAESLSYLHEHFARPDGLGTLLALEALAPHGAAALAVRAGQRASTITSLSIGLPRPEGAERAWSPPG